MSSSDIYVVDSSADEESNNSSGFEDYGKDEESLDSLSSAPSGTECGLNLSHAQVATQSTGVVTNSRHLPPDASTPSHPIALRVSEGTCTENTEEEETVACALLANLNVLYKAVIGAPLPYDIPRSEAHRRPWLSVLQPMKRPREVQQEDKTCTCSSAVEVREPEWCQRLKDSLDTARAAAECRTVEDAVSKWQGKRERRPLFTVNHRVNSSSLLSVHQEVLNTTITVAPTDRKICSQRSEDMTQPQKLLRGDGPAKSAPVSQGVARTGEYLASTASHLTTHHVLLRQLLTRIRRETRLLSATFQEKCSTGVTSVAELQGELIELEQLQRKVEEMQRCAARGYFMGTVEKNFDCPNHVRKETNIIGDDGEVEVPVGKAAEVFFKRAAVEKAAAKEERVGLERRVAQLEMEKAELERRYRALEVEQCEASGQVKMAVVQRMHQQRQELLRNTVSAFGWQLTEATPAALTVTHSSLEGGQLVISLSENTIDGAHVDNIPIELARRIMSTSGAPALQLPQTPQAPATREVNPFVAPPTVMSEARNDHEDTSLVPCGGDDSVVGSEPHSGNSSVRRSLLESVGGDSRDRSGAASQSSQRDNSTPRSTLTDEMGNDEEEEKKEVALEEITQEEALEDTDKLVETTTSFATVADSIVISERPSDPFFQENSSWEE